MLSRRIEIQLLHYQEAKETKLQPYLMLEQERQSMSNSWKAPRTPSYFSLKSDSAANDGSPRECFQKELGLVSSPLPKHKEKPLCRQ